ncbi:MAG: hypothetical protein GKR93_12185 [Gammaproteobacteria bacterium]|nr:hypothetical protein [Gammaproteobacteria bacterium]
MSRQRYRSGSGFTPQSTLVAARKKRLAETTIKEGLFAIDLHDLKTFVVSHRNPLPNCEFEGEGSNIILSAVFGMYGVFNVKNEGLATFVASLQYLAPQGILMIDKGLEIDESLFEILDQKQLDMTPANFDDNPQSLQNLLEFPELLDDVNVFILCDSLISRSGLFEENICYSKDDLTKKLAKSVAKKSRISKIRPAVFKGKTKKVHFQYMVHFKKVGSEENIRAYSNHGNNIQEYGLGYNAPQRYRRVTSDYFSQCSSIKEMTASVRATIDKYGRPNDVEFFGVKGVENCLARMTRKFQKGFYIPTFFKGAPVSTKYTETFVNPSSQNCSFKKSELLSFKAPTWSCVK